MMTGQPAVAYSKARTKARKIDKSISMAADGAGKLDDALYDLTINTSREKGKVLYSGGEKEKVVYSDNDEKKISLYKEKFTQFLKGEYPMEGKHFYPGAFESHLLKLWGMPQIKEGNEGKKEGMIFLKAIRRLLREEKPVGTDERIYEWTGRAVREIKSERWAAKINKKIAREDFDGDAYKEVKHISKPLLYEYVQWLKLRKDKIELVGYALRDFQKDRAKYCSSSAMIEMPTPANPKENISILKEIKSKVGLGFTIDAILKKASSDQDDQELDPLHRKGLLALKGFAEGNPKRALSDTSEDEDD